MDSFSGMKDVPLYELSNRHYLYAYNTVYLQNVSKCNWIFCSLNDVTNDLIQLTAT